MNKSWIIPVVCFVAGAILVMVLMSKCDNGKMDKLTKDLAASRDSIKKVVDENNILTKQRIDLEFEKTEHDSANHKTIDSLRAVIGTVKISYYRDTMRIRQAFINLQNAYNIKDSNKVNAAFDSLVIEARSANWEATNLFYQYGELDSIWRLQKEYDDSAYGVLYMIDSAKDKRFDALLSINNQIGNDLEKSIKEIQRLKSGKKWWFAIGALLGLSTNFLHK